MLIPRPAPFRALLLPLSLGLALAAHVFAAPAVPTVPAPGPSAPASKPALAPLGSALGATPGAAHEAADAEAPGARVAKRGARVAMIDFESASVDEARLKAISQAFWARLDAMDGLALYPREATRRWLIRNDLFPFTPYMTPPPPGRITSALKADYLLTGHLSEAGGVLTLDFSLYSGGAGRYLLTDVKVQKEGLEQLLPAFSGLAAQVAAAVRGGEAALHATPSVEKAPAAAKSKALSPSYAARAGAKKKASEVKSKPAAKGKKGVRKASPTRVTLTKRRPKAASSSAAEATRPAAVEPRAAAPVAAAAAETDEQPHGAPAPQAAAKPAAEKSSAEPAPESTPAASNQAPPAASSQAPLAASTAAPAPEATPAPTPAPTPEESILAPRAATKPQAASTPAPTPKPQATPAPSPAAAAHAEEPAPSPTPASTPAPHATPGAQDELTRAQALLQEALSPSLTPAERVMKLNQAAALAPRDLIIQQQLALELYGQKRFDSCISQCDAALRNLPDNSRMLTIKGSALIELGRYAEAAKAEEAALKADPENYWAAFNQALALTWAGSDRAAPSWRSFLSMAGNKPDQQELVAQARQHLARLEGAGAAPAKPAAAKSSGKASPAHAKSAPTH